MKLPLMFIVALGLFADSGGAFAHLRPATIEGWNQYVAAVESRRAAEVGRADRFLVMDHGSTAVADRRAVMAGALVVHRVDAPAPGGPAVEVEDGMVHHWRGAVLLRGVTLDALMRRLQTEAPPTSPEVLRADVLDRGPSFIKVFLRLQRTKIVTAVYNTEHDVRFVTHSPTRVSSRSVATRIAEVDDAGTPAERERAPGEDRGFLWKLNAYWRYEAVPGGVIAECESISLSRDVPFGLGAIAGPIIRSTARESMERALQATREFAGSSGPVGALGPSGAS
jgi:hypothetical protein